MIAILLVAALSFMLWTPAASAQHSPVTIGEGAKPALTIDAAGTAYIAWYGTGSQSALHFCRLARGAQTCAGAPTIVTPGATNGTSLSQPFVSVTGLTVRVVQHRYGYGEGAWERAMLFSSSNAGDSWDAGVPIATGPTSRFEAGVLDTGTRFLAVLNGGGFRSMPLTPGEIAGPVFNPLPGLSFSASLAELPSGGTLAIAWRDGMGTAFTVSPTGAHTVPSAWGPQVSLGTLWDLRMASTRYGPVLLSRDTDIDYHGVFARRWNGTGFDPPVWLGRGRTASGDLFADAGGRLHAVFPDVGEIVHAVSDDGASWSTGILLRESGEGVRVAAAADHIGVAVWVTDDEIRVTPIGPDAPSAPPQPRSPTPTPPQPTTTPQPSTPEPVAGKQVVVGVRSGSVMIRVPGGRFTPLTSIEAIPVGAQIDARRGAVDLRAHVQRGIHSATISRGIFTVGQKATNTPGLRLVTPPKQSRACASARTRPRKGIVRTLAISAPRGSFRIIPMKGVVTGGNATWTVSDRCDGTHTRVTRGRVTVRSGRRAVTVQAGRSHLLKARLFAARKPRG